MTAASLLGFPETASCKVVELADLKSPTLRLGAEYWRLRRGARLFPARDDIKPDELAAVLRGVAIVRVVDGGEDFEHCMVGEGVQLAYRGQGQGRRLSEVAREMPETARRLGRYYRHVLETRFPLAIRVTVDVGNSEVNFTEVEALLLPLGVQEAGVDHLLTFTEFKLRAGA